VERVIDEVGGEDALAGAGELPVHPLGDDAGGDLGGTGSSSSKNSAAVSGAMSSER
jgi:hypothetical protein